MRIVCLTWLCALGLATVSQAADSAPQHILKVTAPDKAAYVRLFQMGLDLPEAMRGPDVLVVGTEAEKQWLEAQGYTVSYQLKDATRYYATRALAAGAASMGGFRTLSECNAAIDSVVTNYPAIVSAKLTIGTTVEGRPIYAIRISDNPNTDEGEPAVLITGLHHAREPISTHIGIYTMQQLAWNYGTDSLITRLVNEREIWFVPIVNPDGYYFNEQIAPAGGGLWRKNRKDNGGTYGVDPNRNYGYHWGWDNSGSSPNPSDDTYRGTGAFSEKETQALRDFVTARPNIRITLNYHSYSNLLLWAPGFEASYTPDEALFRAIADSATSWNHYTGTPGWGLYLTNGDSDDWMYFSRNVLAFTPEVGGGNDGFWPNPSRIAPLTAENYPVNLFIIDIADAPERVLRPQPPVWDSITVGLDSTSLGLYWKAPDTTSINKPVLYRVNELFGPHRVNDGLESGVDEWKLNGFARTSNPAYQGTYSLYSGTGDGYTATAQMAEPLLIQSGDSLRFFVLYNLETDFDYAYVEASTNGGQTYITVPGNITTNTNPTGNNLGNGITGNSSGIWVPAWFDLSAFAGQEALIRLAYRTDGGLNYYGLYVDNISPVQVFDSSGVVASTTTTSQLLANHPEGSYYFRIDDVDAQGQEARSQTETITYSSGPTYLLGDVDVSGAVTSADIVRMVNHIFKGGPAPLPVWEAGDVDLSGALTAGDIIYLVNYVFKGGPPPGA